MAARDVGSSDSHVGLAGIAADTEIVRGNARQFGGAVTSAGRLLEKASRLISGSFRCLVRVPAAEPVPRGESAEAAVALTPKPVARVRQSFVEASPPLMPLGTAFTPVARLAAESSPMAPRALWDRSDGAEIAVVNSSNSSSGSGSADAPDAVDFWRVQLDAIYRRRNPYKLHALPSLLSKYRGREVLLYRKVCHQYDLDATRLYADPAAWPDETCAEADESDSGTDELDVASAAPASDACMLAATHLAPADLGDLDCSSTAQKETSLVDESVSEAAASKAALVGKPDSSQAALGATLSEAASRKRARDLDEELRSAVEAVPVGKGRVAAAAAMWEARSAKVARTSLQRPSLAARQAAPAVHGQERASGGGA